MIASGAKGKGAGVLTGASFLRRRLRSHAGEQDDAGGLLAEYLGVGSRTLLVLGALVLAAFLAVTLIYSSIFGFETWSSNMQRAGSMMIIRYCPHCVRGAPPAPAGGSGAATGGQL